MTNKKLMRLLEKHTKIQCEANNLYAQIINEFTDRGFPDVISTCIHNTEPYGFECMCKEILETGKFDYEEVFYGKEKNV